MSEKLNSAMEKRQHSIDMNLFKDEELVQAYPALR